MAGETKVRAKVGASPASIGAHETFSITFGDQAENHVGMEKIGVGATCGFTTAEIDAAMVKLAAAAHKVEKHQLRDLLPEDEQKLHADGTDATVLIVRGGIDSLLGEGAAADLLREIKATPKDTKAKMYGRVVNKTARWNNCISDFAQEPDYENKKGTVIDFKSLPRLSALRRTLPLWFGKKADALQAETNYYYDIRTCGIGFHGDTERKIVICARLGATMPMVYRWFKASKPIGTELKLALNHGDLYVMSEKATGCDMKLRKIPTLRHAAGCAAFTTYKPKTRTE
jgi:hypothetical protein